MRLRISLLGRCRTLRRRLGDKRNHGFVELSASCSQVLVLANELGQLTGAGGKAGASLETAFAAAEADCALDDLIAVSHRLFRAEQMLIRAEASTGNAMLLVTTPCGMPFVMMAKASP